MLNTNCDEEYLKKIFIFEEGTNVSQIAEELCSVNLFKMTDLTEIILGQVDMVSIIKEVS